jgi:hypothetical protein
MTEEDKAEIREIVSKIHAAFTGHNASNCMCALGEIAAAAAVNHSDSAAQADVAMEAVHRDLDRFLDAEIARRWATRH